MNEENLILMSDSYKLGHHAQYPDKTETVYSYMESRKGAAHPYTVFFGLQYLIDKYLWKRVTMEDVEEAYEIAKVHFGDDLIFNYEGWQDLVTKHEGKLPIKIRAVPEGSVIPTGNVLVTVENTDPEFYWLTNFVESLLLHVWYPTTVATRSFATKLMFKEYLDATAYSNMSGLPFMLHDFGYRGVSSQESAAIGGAAHLVNFVGTDTLPALMLAMKYYKADPNKLGFSVVATEHSVMTAQGEDGEHFIIEELLNGYTSGILSVVNDSYNFKRHVNWLCTDFHDRIMARDGKFVTRPDSVPQNETPSSVVVWILKQLWDAFGGTVNVQGNKILDPHVGVLWGDGIDTDGIKSILDAMMVNGFSAENIVFGMGGGLLQKVNRDTESFSLKSSAQKRNGEWHNISKNAPGKKSKAGRLQLSVDINGNYETTELGFHHDHMAKQDVLETVFENGYMIRSETFEEIRNRAKKEFDKYAAYAL